MAVIILPGAQDDLLSLQDYMLDQRGEVAWLKAEDEIFDKLASIDAGAFTGSAVKELAAVGILEYQNALTSHHRVVYRRIDGDVFVYAIAAHRQDFPALLMRRLLRA